MRFDIVQHYRATPDEVLAVYTDPSFYADMGDLPRTSRPEVVEHRAADGHVTLRVRFRFTADLPAAALAVVDRERLTWIEESRYDLGARTAKVRLLPDHYPDRLHASASVAFTDDPAVEGGTVRRIAGELRVRMPLVGGKVERAILDGLEEYLDAEQTVVGRRLAR